MLRKNATALLIILFFGIGSNNAVALELGLTPSHVFGLWTNINSALVRLAELYSSDQQIADKLSSMTARTYSGKTPGDVLQKLSAFRKKLDILNKKQGLSPTNKIEITDGKKITPSVVFLNSGHVIDSAVNLIIKKSDRDQLVSPFYKSLHLKGKSPSDVFGMVDLAERRIDIILAKL